MDFCALYVNMFVWQRNMLFEFLVYDVYICVSAAVLSLIIWVNILYTLSAISFCVHIKVMCLQLKKKKKELLSASIKYVFFFSLNAGLIMLKKYLLTWIILIKTVWHLKCCWNLCPWGESNRFTFVVPDQQHRFTSYSPLATLLSSHQ